MKMKLTALFFAVAAAFSLPVMAQDQDAQKAWMDYMTPGKFHEMMARDNGTWDAAISIWPAPGAQAMTSTGTIVYEMILGGRYQQMTFKGDMMGMPFEGIGTAAYDNVKKKFINTWMDNMGTGIMYLEGPWDEATKTIKLSGKQVEPVSGQEITVRQTLQYINDNEQLMQSFTDYEGKEFKTMEIRFKRK